MPLAASLRTIIPDLLSIGGSTGARPGMNSKRLAGLESEYPTDPNGPWTPTLRLTFSHI